MFAASKQKTTFYLVVTHGYANTGTIYVQYKGWHALAIGINQIKRVNNPTVKALTRQPKPQHVHFTSTYLSISFNTMQDAVRPTAQAFKAIYERGYHTWSNLHQKTITEASPPWLEYLLQLETAFPHHPSFPDNLALGASFSNTVNAKGISAWNTGTSPGNCDLPPFEREFRIPVASDRPVVIEIEDLKPDSVVFSRCLGEEGNDHVALLILAWTYVLSARWAEIIPGVLGPEYTSWEAGWEEEGKADESERAFTAITTVDLGDIDDDAARWWSAVLAVEGGWKACIQNEKGHILHSPWYTKLISEHRFILSRSLKCSLPQTQYHAASFTTALHYLSSYCDFHQVVEQSHAALASTLLLPVASYDNSTVRLPTPRLAHLKSPSTHPTVPQTKKFRPWHTNLPQLDKLLTLSCNATGTKSLLTSIFYSPSIPCNTSGAFLRGTFAFLSSDLMQDQHLLLLTLAKRDPALSFLWFDLHTAAWTGTLMSFIQEPISQVPLDKAEISRADEARLLYLCHEQSYTITPLFPWEPFGSTALTDVNIDVRQHARCGTSHGLEYAGLSWRCRDTHPTSTTYFPRIPIPSRAKNGLPVLTETTNISIPYEKLDEDEDDENSEMVTRNIFTWLRDEDGFPIAERAIREHDWIDNLTDDDDDNDEPVTGHAKSSVGGNLHGWLLKTMTGRCNSL
ncbi:hypothetical protein G7Y89_g7181 [Cudoniella acicularis]|uniref:Uncharacterized protein n=1 Tax=Cudoniella acicularis TaxID=354080 RepID=A0A8H4RLN4_9HELO|nr:hypothetical protein G7Y89_g7181 [Cudoniella acicularis]